MRTIKRLVVHHSASSRDMTTLSQINEWHKKKWPNFISKLGYVIGYHYVIGKDWIKQTRYHEEEGAHALNYNSDSIGICLTGDFETESPNRYQLKELGKLLVGLMDVFKLKESDIYSHRDLNNTACPGKNLPKDLILKSLQYGYHPGQENNDTNQLADLIAQLKLSHQQSIDLLTEIEKQLKR